MVIIAREPFSVYGESKYMLFAGSIADVPDDLADQLIIDGKAYKYDFETGTDTDYMPSDGGHSKPLAPYNTWSIEDGDEFMISNMNPESEHYQPEYGEFIASDNDRYYLNRGTGNVEDCNGYTISVSDPSIISVERTGNQSVSGYDTFNLTWLGEGLVWLYFDRDDWNETVGFYLMNV